MTPQIPRDTQTAAFNNAYASAVAAGDPRFNAKPYDKPGLSRGGAQWNQAGIDGANKMAEGIAAAYSQDLQTGKANSDAALQSQRDERTNSLALAALQQQNNYANQLAALQRQGMALNLMSSLLGGLTK
jgi:hypothetical protein